MGSRVSQFIASKIMFSKFVSISYLNPTPYWKSKVGPGPKKAILYCRRDFLASFLQGQKLICWGRRGKRFGDGLQRGEKSWRRRRCCPHPRPFQREPTPATIDHVFANSLHPPPPSLGRDTKAALTMPPAALHPDTHTFLSVSLIHVSFNL